MLGAMGHPALKEATHNIDNIASKGVLFENAYCSHPICCPSRANMWSGKYTHNSESWNNHKGLETGMWNLLDQLHETHNVKILGNPDYLSGGHTLPARISAWLCSSGIRRPVYDNSSAQSFNISEDYNPRFHARDWNLVDAAVSFLSEQASHRKKTGKPFFLYVTTGLVHPPFHTNRYWLEKIPGKEIDIPRTDKTSHPCRIYQQMSKAWLHGHSEDTVRQVRRIYFAMCAEADAMAGAVHKAMCRLGLQDDTYFIFSSDHGELALEHQEWYKMSMYEGSVRVPLVISGPGIKKGSREKHIVSLIDICPTIMGMSDNQSRNNLDGESLIPLAEGKIRKARDYAYSCFTGSSLNTSSYMLRKDRYKYVAFAGFQPQLFDIDNDPEELEDISRQQTDIAKRLEKELRLIVDYQKTHEALIQYNKKAFIEWRRLAKRGVFLDSSYSLRQNPSSDYWKIMNNCFTGYDKRDEEKITEWLKD